MEKTMQPVKGKRSRSESIFRQDFAAKSTSRASIACENKIKVATTAREWRVAMMHTSSDSQKTK